MVTVFLTAAAMTLLLLLICFAAMAIGLILRGRRMRGGCGSAPAEHADGSSACEHCAEKKKTNLCSSEGDSELVEASKLGTMGRYDD